MALLVGIGALDLVVLGSVGSGVLGHAVDPIGIVAAIGIDRQLDVLGLDCLVAQLELKASIAQLAIIDGELAIPEGGRRLGVEEHVARLLDEEVQVEL